MPRCRDCAEQDGFDGMCLAKGEYKTPNTPACELFFASNAAELKGLRVLNRELRAENVKLQKLVCAAWKCIHSELSCFDCRLTASGCTLQSAMRELGIEVE